jgi:putative phosphonate metabolism protein
VTWSPQARVALFYAPETDDPLFDTGATWLGRDPESGAPAPHPDVSGIAALTEAPRLYGFHATLKPPMRLRPGVTWDRVLDEAAGLAASVAPFDLPPLRVADLYGFLALREIEPSMPLQALCDLCVAHLEPLRVPAEGAELERRRAGGLSASQEALLRRWGYPYVFGAWSFHMTLTRRLDAREWDLYLSAAEHHFARALREQRRVATLCLFTQPAPGEPFMIAERLKLRG